MTLPVLSTRLVRLELFSQWCGLHPDHIRRLVALGIVEPRGRTDEELWFSRAQVARVDRMNRLRRDLSLNYSALALVADLLDRIDQLERSASSTGEPTQTDSSTQETS